MQDKKIVINGYYTSEFDEESLLNIYSEYDTVRGPFVGKDGRKRLSLYATGPLALTRAKPKFLSYPKAVFEAYHGYRIKENETIDHIDRNFNNNEISNLQVLDRSTHCRLDNPHRNPVFTNCAWCNKRFELSRDQLSTKSLKRGRFFCSKQCTGLYGKMIQEYGDEYKVEKKEIKITYYFPDK